MDIALWIEVLLMHEIGQGWKGKSESNLQRTNGVIYIQILWGSPHPHGLREDIALTRPSANGQIKALTLMEKD